MGKNFFRDMQYIESKVKSNDVKPEQASVFALLVDFIEEGKFTKSQRTGFICRNWRYNTEELAVMYEKAEGKKKSKNTFRGQVSELSRSLFQLFPTFSETLFLSDSLDEEGLNTIAMTIDAVRLADMSSDGIFISDVTSYPDSVRYDNRYDISELDPILVALKPFLRTQVLGVLDNLDVDKLKYILSVLRSPLVQTHGKGVSVSKLEMLQRLGIITPVVQTATKEKKVAAPKIVYVQEEVLYKFDTWKDICKCLEEYADKPDPEHQGYSADSEEFQKAMKRVSNILSVYTVEGLKTQLERCWPTTLKLALDRLRK